MIWAALHAVFCILTGMGLYASAKFGILHVRIAHLRRENGWLRRQICEVSEVEFLRRKGWM